MAPNQISKVGELQIDSVIELPQLWRSFLDILSIESSVASLVPQEFFEPSTEAPSSVPWEDIPIEAPKARSRGVEVSTSDVLTLWE